MTTSTDERAPLVTVLLPVYNAAPFLQAALDSILMQTFADFELLAIEDGSTDDGPTILKACTDPRLQIITHARNRGLIASLNEGIERARGRYIARMDADDLMVPDRLASQVAFLETNPGLAAVAGFVETMNAEGEVTGVWDIDLATPDEGSVADMLPRTNCIAHPTVMLRRNALGQLRYDPCQHGAEDWDLWLRMRSRGLRITKLPEVLLQYRQHATSMMGTQKRTIPYECRLLRVRHHFLLREWAQLRFNRLHLAVLKAQARTLVRYLRNNAVLPFLRDAKRLLTYSPLTLWREHRALREAEQHWKGGQVFLFPYLHTGGAEQVHADILATVADQMPLVVVCGLSTDRAFANTFATHGRLLELPRLLHHPFTRHRAHDRLARLINAQERPVLLSSLTNSFFELLPRMKADVRAYHLQHAFLYQPEGNAQHKGWLRHFGRVDGYLFISAQARAEYERFLFAHHVPRSQFSKLQFIPNAVHRFGEVLEHERLGLLFVGRASAEKRLDLFLDLCDALERMTHGRYRFTVVGAATRPGYPYVRFEGRVNDAERMADLYAGHDLLVLTSFREGYPLVVMEAMAQGLAIMATPVGDVPNRLDDSCAVVTSSVEREAVLCEMKAAVLSLDADQPRLQAMKTASLHKARKECDPVLFRSRYRALLINPAS